MPRLVEEQITCSKEYVYNTLKSCTKDSLLEYTTAVTCDLSNLKNSGITIESYVHSFMCNRLLLLKQDSVGSQLYDKYQEYVDVMFKGFPIDGIEFTDAFIHDSENEFWVVSSFANSDISNKFYDVAQKIWKNMFIDVNVIFIGENELKRELLPPDIVHVKINQK